MAGRYSRLPPAIPAPCRDDAKPRCPPRRPFLVQVLRGDFAIRIGEPAEQRALQGVAIEPGEPVVPRVDQSFAGGMLNRFHHIQWSIVRTAGIHLALARGTSADSNANRIHAAIAVLTAHDVTSGDLSARCALHAVRLAESWGNAGRYELVDRLLDKVGEPISVRSRDQRSLPPLSGPDDLVQPLDDCGHLFGWDDREPPADPLDRQCADLADLDPRSLGQRLRSHLERQRKTRTLRLARQGERDNPSRRVCRSHLNCEPVHFLPLAESPPVFMRSPRMLVTLIFL